MHNHHVWRRVLATKRRLELLKGDDMAAYLREVSSVKSSQIQKLLAQTDKCLRQLMKRLQQKKRPSATILDLHMQSAGIGSELGHTFLLFIRNAWCSRKFAMHTV